MNKKHYEIPESELLLVKFEEDFLQGPSTATSNIEIPGEIDDDL